MKIVHFTTMKNLNIADNNKLIGEKIFSIKKGKMKPTALFNTLKVLNFVDIVFHDF